MNKILIVGIAIIGMLGTVGTVVLADSDTVVSEARDLLPRWGGMGGACHGYYRDGGGNAGYPNCHRDYDQDDRSCTSDRNCPYNDNRTA
jgi:hypothetical protein